MGCSVVKHGSPPQNYPNRVENPPSAPVVNRRNEEEGVVAAKEGKGDDGLANKGIKNFRPLQNMEPSLSSPTLENYSTVLKPASTARRCFSICESKFITLSSTENPAYDITGPAKPPAQQPLDFSTYCPFCFENYDVEDLDNHLAVCERAIATGDYVECGFCEVFILHKLFVQHKAKCSQKRVPCKFCDQLVVNFLLQLHLDNNHRDIRSIANLETCVHCGVKISDGDLELHKTVCDCIPVICQFCEEVFKAVDLEQHETTCAERKFACSYCACVFPEAELVSHRNICGAQTLDCTYCREPFLVGKLRQHMKHCGMKPMPCPRCHVIFSKDNLEIHRPVCESSG